jgi:hypothetical protein
MAREMEKEKARGWTVSAAPHAAATFTGQNLFALTQAAGKAVS